MFDPSACIPAKTLHEKQHLAIFAVCVAGKTASQTVPKVLALLLSAGELYVLPFTCIRRLVARGELFSHLKFLKMGQYRRIAEALTRLVTLDIETASLDDLEAIPGIGPKTARFILMYTRKKKRLAVLDTHILAWLREHGYPAPKSTPSGKTYQRLEAIFLEECDKRRMTPIELDSLIWKERSRSASNHSARKSASRARKPQAQAA